MRESCHVAEFDLLRYEATCRAADQHQNFSKSLVTADLATISLNRFSDEVVLSFLLKIQESQEVSGRLAVSLDRPFVVVAVNVHVDDSSMNLSKVRQ